MKSVFKTVAPIAMTITIALSGAAMADTASSVAKSADTATTTQPAKPVVHRHKAKEKMEDTAKISAASTSTEKSVAATLAATEKSVATATDASKKVESSKTK